MTYLVPQTPWAGSFVPRNGFFSSLVSSEMDHLFDEYGYARSPKTFRGLPYISMREVDDLIEVEVELPGVDEKDIEVALVEDVLTIKGRKQIQHEKNQSDYFYFQERAFGNFVRSVALPFEPDPKTVKSYFNNGVLTIAIPKPIGISAKRVKIPVKVTQ